jgi:hypothetical protein
MANKYLEAALQYMEYGFSVIPIVPGSKKPLIKWEPFQKQRATKTQIISWWSQTPDANVGIVTGEVSDLFVVDIDTEEGQENLNQYGFDSIVTPTTITPRKGNHLYFRYPKGHNITIGAGKIKGTDFRGNGGYVVAPPSVNGSGNLYSWIIDLRTPLANSMPEAYIKIISTLYREPQETTTSMPQTTTTTTSDHKLFEYGTRDNDLFHTANCLTKGGMQKHYTEQVLERLILSWGENPDHKWIATKIESALKRAESRERNWTEETREFVLTTNGYFTTTECHNQLQTTTKEAKKAVNMALLRMIPHTLEKHGSKNGCYRLIDQNEELIDYENADINPIPFKFPLGVHEYVTIHRGNVIILAGESNAGKTAYCLNLAYANKDIMPVNYMSSEMQNGAELRIRLDEFRLPISIWKPIKFTFRTDNFPDKINPDGLNIIDYLDEGSEGEAYKMPMRIRLIADKLKNGIAVIAIQKDPNKALGFGGSGTLNRARVYLTIQRKGILTIEKAKIWRDKEDNPNGKYCRFLLAAGCRFKVNGEWTKD